MSHRAERMTLPPKSSTPSIALAFGSTNGPIALITNRAVTSRPPTRRRQTCASSSHTRSVTSLSQRTCARIP